MNVDVDVMNAEAVDAAAVNRESLAHLCAEGIVTADDPLACNVGSKIEAGHALTAAEAGILWFGITADALAHIRQHPELLA